MSAVAANSHKEAFIHNGRMSKVERYKWTFADRPGEFLMIDKDELTVDPSYQRTETENKVKTIAQRWSWIACGTITVAIRNDHFYVVDGSHRVLGARRRSDIKDLPCMVFDTNDIVAEAQGFLDANTLRKPMTMIEKFKALVMVNDEAAVTVRDMIAASGYTITSSAKSGRSVGCIGQLLLAYRSYKEAFLRVWPVILESSDGQPIHDRQVASLVWIEHRIASLDQSLTRQPWRRRVVQLGCHGILDACAKASAYYKSGGAAVWGEGVLNALNHGVRNKLVIPSMGRSEG